MPALANKIPSYRLHRPSGLGIVCLDGKRIYLGKWNSKESREKYRRVVAEWLGNGRRSHGNRPQESIAVVELIDRYLQFAMTYYQWDGKPTAARPLTRDEGAILFIVGRRSQPSQAIQFQTSRMEVNPHVEVHFPYGRSCLICSNVGLGPSADR